MSLSFVSKSIQTSRDDGGYDEQPIATNNDNDEQSFTNSKPLYEQLRDNQNKYDMEQDEYQLNMMRGTLTLNEEDAFHLQAIEQNRIHNELQKKQQIENEMNEYRYAKQKLLLSSTNYHEQNDPINDHSSNNYDDEDKYHNESARLLLKAQRNTTISANITNRPIKPLVFKKKKRDRNESESDNVGFIPVVKKQSQPEDDDATKLVDDIAATDATTTTHMIKEAADQTAREKATGIHGLLSGYSSSSDSE